MKVSKTPMLILFGLIVSLSSFAQSPSRTEGRDDAGLSGTTATSGFFETAAPVNYPANATDWWHLIDVRHTNIANNYAMQFSGSFFDQDLYFRKTNGDASHVWSRILTSNRGLTLSSVTGTKLEMIKLTNDVGPNKSHLSFLNKRNAPTSGWESASTRIQSITDASDQGYIEFNPLNNLAGIEFGSGSSTYMSFLTNGNVGIGTKTPQAKLAVNGDIYSREVKVTIIGWPDYVFGKSYKLPTLKEIEDYINKNHHLPEMPSSDEVITNGLNIGETQALLLKKIEELTLYVIQQQKEIDLLKKALSTK